MSKIVISGTGCALADYLHNEVEFNSQSFHKYQSKQDGDGGLSPGRLVFTEELEVFSDMPYPEILQEFIENKEPDAFNIGGPGLVSLINTAQLLGTEDFEVRFYGGTGKDKTSGLIFDMVNKTPLDISNYQPISEKATPFTDVFSDQTYNNGQGERTFVNNIGAAWDYSPELLADSFFSSHIVCFGGTGLVPQIHDSLTLLLLRAKENNCITVVNTVFDFRNEKRNPGKPWPLGDTQESLRLTDMLIMDCEEALKISGASSIEEAASYFITQDVTFIITNGAKEYFAFSNGKLFQKSELMRLPVSKKVLVELTKNQSLKRDTTGCGDNFAGGLIASIAWQIKSHTIGNFELLEALTWAVASGGFACFYLGGTYLEQQPHEKFAKVEVFKNDYVKQLAEGKNE